MSDFWMDPTLHIVVFIDFCVGVAAGLAWEKKMKPAVKRWLKEGD